MSKVYKLNDVISISNDFDDKFAPLINIKNNEKLIIYKEKLYLDTNNKIFQPLTRWWNNYNRNDTIDFIKQEMTTYLDFMVFVKEAYKHSNKNSERYYYLYDIYNKHVELTRKYSIGLKSLQVTYKHDKEIVKDVKSICEKLNKVATINQY
tara:strand:+ start:509 stop:961 length:453 start_codon:yes stop_codon:yes gene_type:complete